MTNGSDFTLPLPQTCFWGFVELGDFEKQCWALSSALLT
jgi:hypothetical protein